MAPDNVPALIGGAYAGAMSYEPFAWDLGYLAEWRGSSSSSSSSNNKSSSSSISDIGRDDKIAPLVTAASRDRAASSCAAMGGGGTARADRGGHMMDRSGAGPSSAPDRRDDDDDDGGGGGGGGRGRGRAGDIGHRLPVFPCPFLFTPAGLAGLTGHRKVVEALPLPAARTSGQGLGDRPTVRARSYYAGDDSPLELAGWL